MGDLVQDPLFYLSIEILRYFVLYIFVELLLKLLNLLKETSAEEVEEALRVLNNVPDEKDLDEISELISSIEKEVTALL